MEQSKTVADVREWRNRAAEKTKSLSPEEERHTIHAAAERQRKRLGLKRYTPNYHKA